MSLPRPIVAVTVVCGVVGCERAYAVSEKDAQEYAEAACAAEASCCSEATPMCVSARTDELLSYDERTRSPLHFSEACMRDVLAWTRLEDGISCATASALDGPECQLAHGELGKGEACVDFGSLGFYGTDCAEGLECRVGRCSSGPATIQRAPIGGRCDIPGWACVADAYCAPDGSCAAALAPGSACTGSNACAPPTDYHCAGLAAGEGVCTERPTLGQACVEAEDACAFACSESGNSCEKLRCADGICSPRLPAACEDLDGA